MTKKEQKPMKNTIDEEEKNIFWLKDFITVYLTQSLFGIGEKNMINFPLVLKLWTNIVFLNFNLSVCLFVR